MAQKSEYSEGFNDFYNSFPQGVENLNVTIRPIRKATYSDRANRGSTASHVNAGFQQDVSDSEESASSQTDSDSVSDPAWIEKVGGKGELFYVESQPTLNVTVLTHPNDHHKQHCKKRGTNSNLNDNRIHLFQTSSGQTYQASEGEDKEVIINIDSHKHNYGRRTTLCETLLGIIPGEVPDNRTKVSNWDSKRNRIIVKGLAPDGEAIKMRAIKIGDYLISIDDVKVTAENLGHILSKIVIPRKVKLKFQSSLGNTPIHRNSPAKQSLSCKSEKDPIIKYITKAHDSFEDVIAVYKQIPHLFLFIKDFNSSSSDSVFEDGVLYKYPKYENTLATLSGAFITMNQMSVDVTGGAPTNSSLIVEDRLVHVAYHRECTDTLILVIPANCVSHFDIQQIMTNLVRLLHWQFGLLGSAFEDKSNQKILDQLFILFFHNMLSQNYPAPTLDSPVFTTEPFECVPTLLLGSDVLVQLDNHLGELESGDFGDMSEAYYDEQRLFVIAGSCLFYKGLLCSNHLPKDDLTDIYMYSYYHQLLSLTKQEEISQLIIWREVYPSRIRKQLQEIQNVDFKEYNGRWFILMIALNHCLIAVLLKTGGCTSIPVPHPPPDPFYVDQIRNTLLKINNLGLIAVLEKGFQTSLGPEVTSADSAAAKIKDTKRLSKQQILNLSRSSSLQTLSWKENFEKRSTSQSNLLSSSPHRRQDVSTMLKKRIQSHLDGERQQLLTPSIQTDGESDFDRSSDRHDGSSLGMEMSIQTSVSSNSDADSRTSSEDIYRGLKSSRIYGSTFDLSSLKLELENEEVQKSTQLLAGCENTLFQYLTLNTTEGVLVSPLQESQGYLFGPLQNEIITNFQKCVSEIHHVFQSTQKNKDPPRNCDIFRNERGIAPIKEHGVLFKINSGNSGAKKSPSIAYWVVGKFFNVPQQKEVYVCFQDSASQNAIEMAFKLSFGKL